MPRQGRTYALQAMAAALALAAPAAASASDRADYAVAFAQRAPGVTTAMTLHIRYKAPGDPEGKPSPVRHIVLELPPGTRFTDGSRCTADDEQLRASGRAACPAESRVGAGTLTAMTGAPPLDPFPSDVTLFRGDGELIELLTRRAGEETLAFEHLKIEGSRLTADVQQTPGGPPDGETAARDVDWTVPAGWVITPPQCPASGAWTARGEFAFADGGAATDTSTTPCARPAAAGVRPAPLVVAPARVRAGRTARLVVRLAASERCRRGALVRAGGRRARTD